VKLIFDGKTGISKTPVSPKHFLYTRYKINAGIGKYG